ncbi:hypothetical protein GWI33_003238 [Rhynchophorus ferrugineus]|uniref:Uncharacterized protein n=1 Tax=Rhynchophorus ferrugineus TaxID=354439 RepID=A0A834INU5_RHYFE|nr:hypothetical protein GWI33_003238 [Rhynchophorus ferrugineus]
MPIKAPVQNERPQSESRSGGPFRRSGYSPRGEESNFLIRTGRAGARSGPELADRSPFKGSDRIRLFACKLVTRAVMLISPVSFSCVPEERSWAEMLLLISIGI